jgi:hypothetical protein
MTKPTLGVDSAALHDSGKPAGESGSCGLSGAGGSGPAHRRLQREATDLFSKKTALLPPYTTGIVRIRSNLDIKLRAGNPRVAMASCRSKLRMAVRALVKTRERPRRRIRRRTLQGVVIKIVSSEKER